MERIAVFRADASSPVGAGHVMRCLTLADGLAARGWRCEFLCAAGSSVIVPAVRRYLAQEFDAPALGDPRRVRELAGGVADLLVVDHYGLDAGYEAACRPFARHILVLDDLADRRHDCDLMLDQTWGRSEADYAALVPSHCRVLTGSHYSLLRAPFAEARLAALARSRDRVQCVVVSLGGTDPDNATTRVLDALAGMALQIHVVMGGGARHLADVRAAVARLPDARLHVDVGNMADLLSEADLAIGAAGTSAWERCCLALPTLLVVLADNQRLIARNLAAAGAARIIAESAHIAPERLVTAINELAQAPAQLARMSAAAAALCDGAGAERLCAAIEDLGSWERPA